MMTIFALVAPNVSSLCLFIISFFFFRFYFSFFTAQLSIKLKTRINKSSTEDTKKLKLV